MVVIYVRWIMAGKLTIDDVPERWQEAVAAELDKLQGDETHEQ